MSSAPKPYTDEWVEGPLDTKFFTRYQAPPTVKGAVLFVHGFIEHLGRYARSSCQSAPSCYPPLILEQL
jgi:alpha-beta hydrolase superfamily lysophospholipase